MSTVGYRVKSQRGVRFHQWATRVLRDHLTRGYSLNEYRLAQQGLAELEQAVELLGKTLTRQELVSDIGREVVGLILGYAKPPYSRDIGIPDEYRWPRAPFPGACR